MYAYGRIQIAEEVNPRVRSFGNSLVLDCVHVIGFPGDCGALCLDSAWTATEDNLKAIMEIASRTGHSKMFATLVGKDELIQEKKKLFVDCGWTVINEGMSNRNPHKTDIALFYFNPNCKKKGY